MTLQPTVAPYTVIERATNLYNGVLDIFDYNTSSDVTTPLDLALSQVKSLPSRSGNVLVPAAGIGTYILALLQEGFSPEQITAVELNPAYSRLGYGIFNRLGVNYVTANFLNWQPRMKFDVIIGNPPYQDASTNSKDKKLWTKFVDKSLDLLVDNGILTFLTPDSLVGRTRLPAKMRKLLSSDYSLDWVNHNANEFFPQVGVDVLSWSVTNRPYTGVTKVTDGSTTEIIDLREDLPTPFKRKKIDSITEKIYSNIGDHGVPALVREYNDIDQSPAENGKYLNYYSGRNKSFYTNDTCKNTGKMKVVFSFSATYKQWFITTDNISGSNLYVEISSVEEGLKIGESLLHPIVMFYVDNWRRTAGYCPSIRNVGALPDIRDLTNEEIISRLKLTEDEYSYIMSVHTPYKEISRVLI